MPKVITKTARKSKYARRCTGCQKEIEPGDTYYTWARRFGRTGIRYVRHTTCGYPRATELSSRKTAQILDEIRETDFSFSEELPADFAPGDEYEIDMSHIEAALGAIAEVARNVADEYESGADAMPENLQYGQQAEAMRECASELADWADTLDDTSSIDTTVDLPEWYEDGFEDEDSRAEAVERWRSKAQDVIDEACQRIADDAEAMTNDMPEYDG